MSDDRQDNEVWAIKFDDAERKDEVFAGYGATQAAFKRFEMVEERWSCHLFRRVAEHAVDLAPLVQGTYMPLRYSFQARVEPWLLTCFGEEIANDKTERTHRFIEEALELGQAVGCTAAEAHQLVDYVYGREIGEPRQEVGGVLLTLAGLCRAFGIDMNEAGEAELARVWTKMEKIRAKQAAKPKNSPLPA